MKMAQLRTEFARQFRRTDKREYAERYADYLIHGEQGECPESERLGYMGQQAVRIRVRNLMGR